VDEDHERSFAFHGDADARPAGVHGAELGHGYVLPTAMFPTLRARARLTSRQR
jgi:hypothetical protein